MSWTKICLGSAIKIKHGFAFKGEYFESTGKYMVLTPGNFNEEGGFRVREGKEKFYSGEIPEGYILSKSDLIVAMTEQGEGLLGSAALITTNDRYLLNQRIGLVTVDENIIYKGFLYLLFNTSIVRQQIRNSCSGAKVRHTSPERIYRTEVEIPPVKTQKKITAILSAYDDLIENNKHRISLLENITEDIYREWFVRFRFPGYQKSHFEKGIPIGWEEKRIDSLGKVTTGKTPATSNEKFYGGDIHFVKTPDMHGNMFINNTEERLTEDGLNSQPSQIIPVNSISVSCIGTGGVVSITTQKCSTNQQINSVSLTKIEDLEWSYFTFKALKQTILAFGATGATMTNLSKGKFSGIKPIVPTDDLRLAFHEIVSPMFNEIKTLMRTNDNLAETKNSLIPRLISGKLSVEDLDIQFPPSMLDNDESL